MLALIETAKQKSYRFHASVAVASNARNLFKRHPDGITINTRKWVAFSLCVSVVRLTQRAVVKARQRGWAKYESCSNLFELKTAKSFSGGFKIIHPAIEAHCTFYLNTS